MKLRITETAWGINRKTGDRSEKVTADVKVPCEVGDIPAGVREGQTPLLH